MRNPFGWDLPPGVTTSMLPGNTKEDEAIEALYNAIYTAFDESMKTEDGNATAIEHDSANYHRLVGRIAQLVSDAWTEGYRSRKAEEQAAQQILSANISYRDY